MVDNSFINHSISSEFSELVISHFVVETAKSLHFFALCFFNGISFLYNKVSNTSSSSNIFPSFIQKYLLSLNFTSSSFSYFSSFIILAFLLNSNIKSVDVFFLSPSIGSTSFFSFFSFGSLGFNYKLSLSIISLNYYNKRSFPYMYSQNYFYKFYMSKFSLSIFDCII